MNCNICGAITEIFASGKILGKYDARYFRCSRCAFIQTEEPYWHKESYSEAITQNDVGMVSRNIALAKITKAIIPVFFARRGRFLDYGGGYGLFVRMMRDCGYDFYWFDRFCRNIFARGFEGEAGSQYELLTAFEVFEHLADPAAELEEMLKLSKNILFATELVPDSGPKPGEWWYYGLEHGQHISFYKKKSLQALADRFRLKLYSDNKAIHLLTEKRVSEPLFRIITRHFVVRKLLDVIFKNNSLTGEDYLKSIAPIK